MTKHSARCGGGQQFSLQHSPPSLRTPIDEAPESGDDAGWHGALRVSLTEGTPLGILAMERGHVVKKDRQP